MRLVRARLLQHEAFCGTQLAIAAAARLPIPAVSQDSCIEDVYACAATDNDGDSVAEENEMAVESEPLIMQPQEDIATEPPRSSPRD